jgi:hypothetical protein
MRYLLEFATHSLEAVKKSNSSRQGAKAQRHAKKNSFVFFAPLREMLFLLGRFFHTFLRCGPASAGLRA